MRRPAPAARRCVRGDGDAGLRGVDLDLVRRMGRRGRRILHARGPPLAARGLHAAARQVCHEGVRASQLSASRPTNSSPHTSYSYA